MSLWAEHLGRVEETYREPQTLKCIRHVTKLARNNWRAYVAESDAENATMIGNLMQYPIRVSRDGKLTSLKGFELFPDVGGKVLGTPTTLPDALTT